VDTLRKSVLTLSFLVVACSSEIDESNYSLNCIGDKSDGMGVHPEAILTFNIQRDKAVFTESRSKNIDQKYMELDEDTSSFIRYKVNYQWTNHMSVDGGLQKIEKEGRYLVFNKNDPSKIHYLYHWNKPLFGNSKLGTIGAGEFIGYIDDQDQDIYTCSVSNSPSEDARKIKSQLMYWKNK